MAKRHSVSPQSVRKLIQQVTPSINTDEDYKFVVRVEGGEVHIGGNTKECFECDAYEALLDSRKAVRLLTEDE